MARNSGLGLRMENIDGAAAAENYNAEESLAVDQEAAAAVGEADMVADETEGLHDDIEASTEAAEELGTEVLPALAEAASDDGMTPREAEHVQARLEKICAKAGIDFAGAGLVMRRENFASTASRKMHTKMRLEAASGVFGKIWENIKKAWLWLKDQLAGIWSKWTSSAEGVKKRLTDIQTRVTSIAAGAKADKSRLKAGARVITVNGEAGVKGGGGTLKAVADSTIALMDHTSILRRGLGSITADVIKAGDDGTGSSDLAKAVYEPLASAVGTVREESKMERNMRKGDAKNEIEAVYGAFPGGRSFVQTKQTFAQGATKAEVAKAQIEVVEERFADDYDAPEKGDISGIINVGLVACNKLISANKNKAELDEAIKQVLANIDSSIKQGQSFADSDKNSDNDELKNKIGVGISVVGSLQALVKSVVTQAPKLVFDVAATAADIAAAAVSNLKEDKK